MSLPKMVNEYLFYEFGFDLQYEFDQVTGEWPFKLEPAGVIHPQGGPISVFSFSEDEESYFAFGGRVYDYFPQAGMTVKDVYFQENGAAWIAQLEPIDLDTSRIGDDSVPTALERRRHTRQLADTVSPSARILLGLYLRKTGAYLAVVEDASTGQAFVIGTSIKPFPVGLPQAHAWRRLNFVIGRLLECGEISVTTNGR